MKSRAKAISVVKGGSLKETAIFFLLLGIVGGCTTGAKVVNNTFYYSYPKMEAKINPEFTYLGDVKYSFRPQVAGGPETVQQHTHSYIFISTEGARIKKMLVIETERIAVDALSFRDSVFEAGDVEYTTRLYDTKDMLDHGSQKLGRKSFKYYERPIYLSPSHPVIAYLSNKGYSAPSCVFLKVFFRLSGRTSLMKIMYLEDLADSGYGCAAWRNIHDLTADQKSYLADLRTNCMNTFDLSSTSKRYKEFKTYKEIKRYIEIKESDAVYEYGLEKYEVWPGDKLEIIGSKTCRSGRGLCWKVRNVKTGEIGYVRADRMKKTHHVYTEEK